MLQRRRRRTEDQTAVRGSGVFARRLLHADEGTAEKPAGTGWQPRGTVLVTGGTGALGARIARWAAEQGAQHLVLTGRRGPDAPGAAALEAELAALGARVTIEACDVADRAAVEQLLARHPVDAVVHAAGVTDSLPLPDLDADRFHQVVAAKVLDSGYKTFSDKFENTLYQCLYHNMKRLVHDAEAHTYRVRKSAPAK